MSQPVAFQTRATGHASPMARALDALRSIETGDADWLDAVGFLAEAFEADSASIVVWGTRSHAVHAIVDHGMDDRLKAEYVAHFWQHDILLENPPAHGQWLVSDERFGAARMRRSPLFGDLFHRYGVATADALALEINSDITVGLSLHHRRIGKLRARDYAEGRRHELTQQVSRSFSAQYSTVRAVRESVAELLAAPGSCLFICDEHGRATSLLGPQRATNFGELRFSGDTLVHRSAESNQRLTALLRQAAAGRSGSIILAGRPGAADGAMRVEAMPLPRHAEIASSPGSVLVRIMPMSARELPTPDDLKAAFGLTTAQARVLHLLCDGRTVTACAEQLQCSTTTVRTHIAHLSARMECRRQAELVQKALLLG